MVVMGGPGSRGAEHFPCSLEGAGVMETRVLGPSSQRRGWWGAGGLTQWARGF